MDRIKARNEDWRRKYTEDIEVYELVLGWRRCEVYTWSGLF